MYDFNDTPSKPSPSLYSSASYGSVNLSDSNEYVDRSRPRSITVICWLSIISLGLGIIQLMSLLKDASSLPGWFWLYLLVNYALTIVAIGGLWNMRKYGAWAFTVQTILSLFFTFLVGAAGSALLGLVFSGIFLYFIYKKYDLME